MIPIDPRMMSAVTWADMTALILSDHAPIPRLLREEDWEEWASYVILIQDIAALRPVQPTYFGNWRDWAAQFNETIRLLEN